MTTDLTERGPERLICKALTGDPCDPPSGRTVGEPPRTYGGVGWSPGNHYDYNRECYVDLVELRTFFHATQPNSAPAHRLDEDCPTRRKFLAPYSNQGWEEHSIFLNFLIPKLPSPVAEDTVFKNARENSDRENARIEHDKALGRVMTGIMKDDTELFRQFVDNQDFKRWLGGVVFEVAYEGVG